MSKTASDPVPLLSQSSKKIADVVTKLKSAISDITDGSMDLTRGEIDRVKPGASEAEAKTDPVLVHEQRTKNIDQLTKRVDAMFKIIDFEHPEFFFKYPGERVPDAFGGTELVSSLRSGFIPVNGVPRYNPWRALIHQDNEEWWRKRVQQMRFVEANDYHMVEEERVDDESGETYTYRRKVYTIGYPEMIRVLGSDMTDQLIQLSQKMTQYKAIMSQVDHDNQLRGLFFEYLRGYDASASISFLTLFARYLLQTPRYIKNKQGVLRRVPGGSGSLEPMQNHLQHHTVKATNDNSSVMDVEGPRPEKQKTKQQEEEEALLRVDPEPPVERPRDPRRKTSLLLAQSAAYAFITALELRLADAVLNYTIYQPAPVDQVHQPLCIMLHLGGLVALEERIDVGDQVQRVFKFYHKADVDTLILYVALATRGTLLMRVPCHTLRDIQVTKEYLFDPTRANDVFFLDTVNNPYECTFCTWMKATPRLEPANGLQIMSTSAVYQRTVSNAAPSGGRVSRREMSGERKAIQKALVELDKEVTNLSSEMTQTKRELAPLERAIQQLEEAITNGEFFISPKNKPQPPPLTLANAKRELKQQKEALRELIAVSGPRIEQLRKDLIRIATDIEKVSTETSAKRELFAELGREESTTTSSSSTTSGVAMAPLALPIEALPVDVPKVIGGFTVPGSNVVRYVYPRDVFDVTSDQEDTARREQRYVHGCKVITIPSDVSGIVGDDKPTEQLRADLDDLRVQLYTDEVTLDEYPKIEYVTVATLCEQPTVPKRPGVHVFEIHFGKFKLNKDGNAYRKVGELVADKDRQPLSGIVLRDPLKPFTVRDFDVIFYDDNLGRSFCVQIEIEEEGGFRYTVCSTSRCEYLLFQEVYKPQPRSGALHLLLFDQLSRAHGYRTVRFPTSNPLERRFDYMFYKQSGDQTCRFIFMKLLGVAIPSVYQIDVEGLQLDWVSSFAPDTRGGPDAGFLYLMLDAPDYDRTGDYRGQRRVVLHLGVGDPMPEYHEEIAVEEQWFLHARLSRLSLASNGSGSGASFHRPCAWCAEPTTLQDDATGRYYCDTLCQSLPCKTKRLM